MKLIYSFFSFLSLLFCSGCSDDIEVAKQEFSSVFLTQETSTYRTKENAIIEVERFIQKDKGATRTGSPLNYSIGNEIYFYRDTITNQDYPSFYIANADGGNGYAIVSANPYTTPIIAYSESGNLSLSDTLQHPEFSFFFDLVQNYISNTEKYKTEFEEDVDNSLDMPQTRARRRPLYETKPGEWQETERIKPLISVKWGQRSPYNNAAPFIKGQRALTGCVATATAQVMVYHEKPSEYNGVSYNWSEMKKDPYTPAVAHLLRSIGNLVKMDWGVDASG
ncbi:C10 family peptidase, partial [Bacteroides fragilis]|nr:C10 family peptidase [Bacteroides fragilis]MCE8606197.1 C10 family peptidase [Bacteroides fragilis]MCE8610189.1 C10 family peptidase [Bacteroides fragilis]